MNVFTVLLLTAVAMTSAAFASEVPPSTLLPEQFSTSASSKSVSDQEFVVKTAASVTRPCIAVPSHDKDIDLLISKELIENLAKSGSTVAGPDEQERLASIYGLRAKLLLKSISTANLLNGCAVASVDDETQYLLARLLASGQVAVYDSVGAKVVTSATVSVSQMHGLAGMVVYRQGGDSMHLRTFYAFQSWVH